MVKWTNEQGQTQRYYPMEKMEGKWQDIGEQLGLEFSQLQSISTENQKNAAACFRAVLGKWFEDPPPGYPTTWGGLLELLEDCKLTEIVSDLKDALVKANVS